MVALMKSAFYVNNLETRIKNTKNKIFMPTYFVYFTKKSIYVTLVPSFFTNRASPFLYLNVSFLF